MKKTFALLFVLFFAFLMSAEAQFYFPSLKAKKFVATTATIQSLTVDTMIINTDTILNVGLLTAQVAKNTLAVDSVLMIVDSVKIDSIWFHLSDLRPYTSYTALLTTADDTLPPTATTLKNNLGATITWTKTDTGTYVGTCSASILTATKTYVPYVIWISNTACVYAYRTADNTVTIVHKGFNGARINGLSGVPFEIRRYLY